MTDPILAEWNQLKATQAANRIKNSKSAESNLVDKILKALEQKGKVEPGSTLDNNPDEYLGWKVAISGNTAAVSALLEVDPSLHEAVFVFVRTGSAWTFQAKLNGTDQQSDDRFGYSIDISGDSIAVGAPNVAGVNGVGYGAVYVFVRNGAVWSQQQKIAPATLVDGDQFGSAVAIEGNVLLVGAPNDSTVSPELLNHGKVYAFGRASNVWTLQQEIVATDRNNNDRFGYSIAVDGITALIGALSGDRNTPSAVFDCGTAYIFTQSGITWTQQTELAASDAAEQDNFGISVALSGQTAVIGAIGDDAGTPEVPLETAGAGYAFFGLGATWAQQAKFVASSRNAFDRFGFDVSVSGDTAVLGAYLDDVGANSNAGSATVFFRTASVWSEQAQLSANDNAAGDRFGIGVAISTDFLLVGAPNDETANLASEFNSGSVRSFLRNGTIWSELATVRPGDSGSGDGFGISVALSGTTAAVGAYLDDNALGLDVGSVYVYVLTGIAPLETWVLQQQIIPSDGAAGDQFGVAIDLDGNTLVVGADKANPSGQADAGSVYVYFRTGSTWALQQKLVGGASPVAGNRFGSAVALQGDRLVASAPHASAELTSTVADAGAVFVFQRSASTWSAPIKLFAQDAASADLFGASVDLDLNTIAVGAPLEDAVTLSGNVGGAYVFFFDGNNWAQQQKLSPSSFDSNDEFGNAVAVFGDTLAIGASKASVISGPSTLQDAGTVTIFDRATNTWTETTKLFAPSPVQNDLFGSALALEGNLLLVGSIGRSVGSPLDTGTVMSFANNSGWSLVLNSERKAADSATSDQFGFAVDLSGDWAIFGAPLDDATAGDSGSAYLFKENFVIFADGFEN